jgi:hypothetical protein
LNSYAPKIWTQTQVRYDIKKCEVKLAIVIQKLLIEIQAQTNFREVLRELNFPPKSRARIKNLST